MLREFPVAQKEDGIFRRWFRDGYFDLVVWYSDRLRRIVGFQLCYDIRRDEHAFTWHEDGGFTHHRIDDGDRVYAYKGTAQLVADGMFPAEEVLRRFLASCGGIDEEVSRLVEEKIREFIGEDAR